MSEWTDDEIRQALLDAATADFEEAIRNQPGEVSFSEEYLAWETAFLRDPLTWHKKKLIRKRDHHGLGYRKVAGFVLAIFASLGIGICSGPYIIASVVGLFENPPQTETGYEVGIQLDGRNGSVYDSTTISMLDENGETIWFWFQNHGESDCVVKLYRKGAIKDKCVKEITVASGTEGYAAYQSRGDNNFYVRITCIDGGGSSLVGKLRVDQYH